MKKHSRILSLVMLVILMITLISCDAVFEKLPFEIPGLTGGGTNTGDNNDGGDGGDTSEGFLIINNKVAQFNFVYTAEAGEASKARAEALVEQLRALGVTINDPVSDTDKASVTDCEIVIGTGARNRGKATNISKYDLGKEGLLAKFVGKRIVIAGGTEELTLSLFESFIREEMKITADLAEVKSIAIREDYIVTKATDYKINSIKICNIDLSEFTLIYSLGDVSKEDQASIKEFRDALYDVSGYRLSIGNAVGSDTDEHAFIIRLTDDAGAEGFRAFCDNKNFIVECSYKDDFADAFLKFTNELFYESKETDIKIDYDYKYVEDLSEIGKNTVDSDNQLDVSQFVSYFGNPDAELRIMFVGNSITRHGPKPSIGWTGDWGMAASSKDKDYVHLLKSKVEGITDAYFCICQAATWERNFTNGEEQYHYYEKAREFDADIIIMRIIENCSTNMDSDVFYEEYTAFMNYLDNGSDARFILTSSFWIHKYGDAVIKQVAGEYAVPYVYLGDLGEDDAMKATGLFENKGVAMHPGDLGMAAIADRIWEKLKPMLG